MTKAQLAAKYFGVTRETHSHAYRNGLYGNAPTFLWPAPDTPGREGDVWLGVLVRHGCMVRLECDPDGDNDFEVVVMGSGREKKAGAPDPAPAILAACLAADPAFAAQWKEASDAN